MSIDSNLPSGESVPQYRERRNREIGKVLKGAREALERRVKGMAQWTGGEKRYSVNECAGYLGISRTRYSNIEAGIAAIQVPELEALAVYLEIPTEVLFPQGSPGAEGRTLRSFSVNALPGEIIHLTVDVPQVNARHVKTSDLEKELEFRHSAEQQYMRRKLWEVEQGKKDRAAGRRAERQAAEANTAVEPADPHLEDSGR
jgi:transcriptional regulator with XRE-family HTH domain